MSASQYERDFKHQLEAEGWTVFRSAGSLAIDLVALRTRDGRTEEMLVEVKSFKGDTFSIKKTKRMKAQWADMMKLSRKFTVRYALRMKGQKTFKLVKPEELRKPYHWAKRAHLP
jgi:Holliday junction resolvase